MAIDIFTCFRKNEWLIMISGLNYRGLIFGGGWLIFRGRFALVSRRAHNQGGLYLVYEFGFYGILLYTIYY